MLGPRYKYITVVLLLVSVTASSSPTAYNCLPGYYHDDKGCTKCSQCPVGYGVKDPCSETEDTQCQPCIEGYDYSNTNGYDECILCDTYSNCLPGKPKLIKKCTVSSPPECNGCEDGYYIDSEVNGCVECSSPCRIDEEEVQKCLTKHDRICKPRGTDAVPKASSSPTTSTSTNNSKEKVTLMSTKRRTVVTKTDAEIDKTYEVPKTERLSRAEGTRSKHLKIFIPVGVVVVVVILLVAVALVYRARRRKSNDNVHETTDHVLQPFLRIGLDRFLRELSTDEKKKIIREISGSRCGYHDWHVVLEKLDDPGLLEESRGWQARDDEINIKKFLEAYGEREGSTVKRLIQAIRDAGLGLSANKLIEELGSVGDGLSGDTDEILTRI